MKEILFKRKMLLPFLHSKKNRILFKFINGYLIFGMVSLLVTIYYLLVHLNIADSIIQYCYPGFALGISSGIIYFWGYQSMTSEMKKDQIH
jgi:hypothetical protein